MTLRSGIGYDSHRLVEGRALILGGIEIEDAERGLEGHSDADALTHAVIDALLGATGLGDIGLHFPDSDARWRDADSIALLRDVVALAERAGWSVGNVDATVICEAPKLGPYRERMRTALAAAIGIAPDAVNVKFTTNERMGAIGRGEGVAALAAATVRPAGEPSGRAES